MLFKYSANFIKGVKSGKISIKIQRKISPKNALFARTRAREFLMYLRARVRAHRGVFKAFFAVLKSNFNSYFTVLIRIFRSFQNAFFAVSKRKFKSKIAINNPYYIL
ncbi:MAG TPA: hypothetical protein DEF02_05095 [Clostridiales bacterium]|nr:hypothetical protein [Clostridiales bacterium]HBW05925.1 hypothetical protein [Clostridiales bacterium]